MACYEKRPAMAYVDSRRGITNLHVPRSKVQAKRTAKLGIMTNKELDDSYRLETLEKERLEHDGFLCLCLCC